MTSFEEAAEHLIAGARAYREAAKAPNEKARDYWLGTAIEEQDRAREAAQATIANLAAGHRTIKERILDLLPDEPGMARPQRLINAGLALQRGGEDLDSSNLRRHLRELERDGLIGARQRKGSRVETCYYRTAAPTATPPPMASTPQLSPDES